MRFYTNVQLVGNQFLVRGYDNGEHFAPSEKSICPHSFC